MSKILDLSNSQTDLNSNYNEAISLHNQIIESGNAAATSLLEMCRCLKRMRDLKLYTALDFGSFEDYAEQMAGIKKRQAYKYIYTYEQFGDSFLQKNASLGVTKLELLAQIPAMDRDDFMEENKIEELSVKEFKELSEKYKQRGEQLSLLQAENEELKAEKDTASEEEENSEAEARERIFKKQSEELEKKESELRKLKEKLINLEQEQSKPVAPSEAEIKKIKKEAKIEAEDKAKAAIEKARIETEEKIKKAEQDKANVESQLKAIQEEHNAAKERAAKLEKELKLKSSAVSTEVMVHFEELKATVSKIVKKIQELKSEDEETAQKLSGGIIKFLDQVKQII